MQRVREEAVESSSGGRWKPVDQRISAEGERQAAMKTG